MQKRFVLVVAMAVSLAVAAAIAWIVPKLRVRADALVSSRAVLRILEAAPADNHACGDRELVGKLAVLLQRVDAGSWYWRLPVSWFHADASAADARRIVDEGLRQVVMPDIACRLERRAEDLSGFRLPPAPAQWEGESFSSQAGALSNYLISVAELEAARDRLREVGSTGGKDVRDRAFAELLAYVHGGLPAGFDPSAALAGDVARSAAHVAPRFFTEFRQKTAVKVEESIKALRLQLEQDVHAGPEFLKRMHERRSADDAARAQRWLAWVNSSWLAAGEAASPCETVRMKIAADAALLVAHHGYPSSLEDAPDVFDSAHCYEPLMKFLASVRVPPYGPLLQKEGDGSFRINSALR